MAYVKPGQQGYDPANNPDTAEYKRKQAEIAKTTSSNVMENYPNYQQQIAQPISYNPATPTGITNQMDYTKGLSTAYTPEQELAMRNRIRSTDTAQNAGNTQRIRDYMASVGLGGSGQEASALMNAMRGQNATRQGALSNLDISNAQTGLQNRYAKAGMLNQLTGMGEQARQSDIANLTNQQQFNTAQGNNMFQWGKEFDWNKYKDEQTQGDYDQRLALLYQQLGISNPNSPYKQTGSGGVSVGWGR
jgi:hypothetical protein